jgi:Ser/Thr protein kinase RdoA (MazF antagonist)
MDITKFINKYDIKVESFESIGKGLNRSAYLIICKDVKYVLKVHKKDSQFLTEILFNNYLAENNFPVAKIIKNLEKDLITKDHDWLGALFEFRTGIEIDWDNLSINFAEDLAETVSNIHKNMLNKRTIPAEKTFGFYIRPIEKVTNDAITRLAKKFSKEAKNVKTSDLRHCLIHGDLTRENVLSTENRDRVQSIIDFGDAHIDFIAWDLAVLITHIFITKTYGLDYNALTHFIRRYDSIFPLTRNEKNMLVTFMKIRNLNLSIEVNLLQKNNTGKKLEELHSIESSVLRKIEIIEQNEAKLLNLLNY